MAEFIAVLLTLGIFVGLPAWLIWSIIARNKKNNISKTKAEPVIEWAVFKGYPLPEKPYGFLFNVAIICGFLCGLIPGILLCYFAQKRKDNYEKEIRALTTKWVDSGKPLKPYQES
tara:strand:+ start:109 stop:456 length:348 start_codon:yes stop_codon:yes gene_type:complete